MENTESTKQTTAASSQELESLAARVAVLVSDEDTYSTNDFEAYKLQEGR
jgi:hypothetical protein